MIERDVSPAHPVLKYLFLLIAVAVVGVVVFIRWRLLDMPFERDEGEYALSGWLLTQGVAPYSLACNMKFPGAYFLYALVFFFFGATIQAAHGALLVASVASGGLLFFLGRSLAPRGYETICGASATALFMLWALTPGVQGLTANTEPFAAPCFLGGLAFLLSSFHRKNNMFVLLGGVCMGLALLIKQHNALFCVLGGLWVFAHALHMKNNRLQTLLTKIALYALGVCSPVLLTGVYLAKEQVLGSFWFWTVTYAAEYAAAIPVHLWYKLLLTNGSRVMESTHWQPLILTLGGMIYIAISPRMKTKRFYLFSAMIFSFLAVCPGFYFRPHYFILALPAAALLSAVAVAGATAVLSGVNRRLAFLLPILLGFAVWSIITLNHELFFTMPPEQATRSIYKGNKFPESREAAQFVSTITQEQDHIIVLGSEPQIYFYAKRRPGTKFMYTYPLMEQHQFALDMQYEMLEEIKTGRPKVIVFMNTSSSWVSQPNSFNYLVTKAYEYLQEHYFLAAIVTDTLKTSGPQDEIADASILVFQRVE